MKARGLRWSAFSLGIILLSVGTLPFALTTSIADPGLPRVGGFLAMVGGLALVRGFFPLPDRWGSRAVLLLLVATALLPRLLLGPAAVSDDVHRYRWEGRLVLERENPYRGVADDPRFADFRDADWERMNHRDRGTVYPPLAQGLFAGMAAAETVVPRIWIEKGFFVACDLGIFALVLLLLRRRHLPPSFSLFYALNPVILVSFAGEAHYDSAFVLPLVAAVLALETGRFRGSWLLLAISIQIKLISVILIPLWIVRKAWRGIGIALAFVLLTWLPFAGALPAWVAAVVQFGGDSAHFGLLPFLFRTVGLPVSAAAPIGATLFLLAVIGILLRGGSPATLARRILASLLLFSPILHFWYLAWLAPFLALRPALSWLWLSAAQALYFLVWQTQAETGFWALPGWVEPVVWIPFLALGLGEGARLLYRRERNPIPSGGSVGIVIPTLNAADSLPACLASIRAGSRLPDQCLVVDGGSTDGTTTLARQKGVEVVHAPPGRGSQIEYGVRKLQTGWILVLHADCRLHPEAVSTIQSLDGEVVGGACGQRFHPGNAILTLVEFMNEGRAVHGESYWGDQGQFFRKSARKVWAGLADYPLMEDVELSRRLRRAGETRYLGLETRAGTAKWQSGNRARRFLLVFRVVLTFRWATLRGRGSASAKRLYQEYYSG